MSAKFVTVQWNKRKILYDLTLVVGVVAYYLAFKGISGAVLSGARAISAPVLEMRALGSCAFLMLVLILSIGPLARLDRRFAPLLYNRRHFGVLFFFVAAAHANAVLGFYHAFGDESPYASLLHWDAAFTARSLPFQLFGAAALVVFLVMAVSSHDFWQKLLGAALWKWLHMGVYLAFALVVLHVAFGALADEMDPGFVLVVVLGCVFVVSLHLAAAQASNGLRPAQVRDGWIDAGSPEAIPEGRAIPVEVPGGERIALIRHDGKVSAVHGVCAHQGGPLYEGKVIDGCLTCPWHGWQYKPEDGCSPPPFEERLPTYRVRLSAEGRVLVDPKPLAPGTATPPIELREAEHV
ncbi:MAG: Rieske 2Fe-2S domain-containing protein [Sandaracinaceae bacterium]